LSSQMTFEIPIFENKTSLLLSGRTSYLAWILKGISFLKDKMKSNIIDLGLYDANIKLSHKFNTHNLLSFGFYQNSDWFYNEKNENTNVIAESKDKIGFGWGNTLLYLNYTGIINSKFSFHSTFGVNKYLQNGISENSDKGGQGDYFKMVINSNATDYVTKNSVKYNSNRMFFETGFELSKHEFRPNILSATIKNGENSNNIENKSIKIFKPINISAFINANYKIISNLEISGGLRFSKYSIEDTSFLSYEPRISLKFNVNKNLWLKGSYDYTSQNLHLLMNNFAGAYGTDLWLPVTKNTNQQNAEQYSFGFTGKYKGFSVGIDAYYKQMNNLIAYKLNGFTQTLFRPWEELIETGGQGTSKGIEFWTEKSFGDFTGYISYTLSKTDRTFKNIDFGQSYPFKYDRRHDFSLNLQYKFNEKVSFSASWVYMTGHAISLPTGIYKKYQEQNNYENTLYYYGNRNSSRMPAYHRLDLSMQYQKQKKLSMVTWHFGLYNAYYRKNAYYISPFVDEKTNKFYQETLFPIIPSIKYEMKF